MGELKMKNTTKSLSTKLIIGTLVAGFAISSGVGITQAEIVTATESIQTEQATKYPSKVMETVRLTLGVEKHDTSLDGQINALSQVAVMDKYLGSFGNKVKGKEVRQAVNEVFNIDLDTISEKNYGSKLIAYHGSVMESVRVSLNIAPDSTELDAQIMSMPKAEVMDRYIQVNDYSLTGDENRLLINQIFGVNLTGISGLEHAQLSINSKGQWVIQNDNDLFVISSSLDDVSLYVGVTDYFVEQTGSNELPESLKAKLISFGFTYDEMSERYTYTNPTGESAPDAFKGQTIGAILTTINTEYPEL
jgi:hypothetical protein